SIFQISSGTCVFQCKGHRERTSVNCYAGIVYRIERLHFYIDHLRTSYLYIYRVSTIQPWTVSPDQGHLVISIKNDSGKSAVLCHIDWNLLKEIIAALPKLQLNATAS